MNKNLALALLLLSFLNHSFSQVNSIQIEDSSRMTVQRYRDTCFGLLNLSTTLIPSGYLIDYSLSAFSDSNFNSTVYSSVDTLFTPGSFFAVYSIMKSSKVNANAGSLVATDSLYMNAYRYKRDNNSIPLLFLFQAYQKIRKTALSEGLFTITSDSLRIKDVAGRTNSPYDNKKLFVFSPLKNIINQSSSINFSLPAQFWMMPGITSVQIDFGDGTGFRTISQGGTASVYYNAPGTYYLTAKIVSSGTTYIAKSSVKYNRPAYQSTPDSVWNFSVAPLYTNITDYLNQHGTLAVNGIVHPMGIGGLCSDGSIFDQINCDINPGATVRVVNGCDRIFDKPIIVVEGFDPTDDIGFDELINYFNYNYYINSLPSFYATMRSAGYDFVFVNFTKNTDFIENNAQVLESIIQKVNVSKTGTNKSTVIGISMGGLVARWALKDMEDKGIDHKVMNYFSYDSPHQGANIPLGLQFAFSEMFKDLEFLRFSKDLVKLHDGFISYAAQQMLVTYGNAGNSALSPVRAAFAQSLINKGYPHNTTNYAVSLARGNNSSGTVNAGNGTQFGNFTPGSNIFSGGIILYLDNMSVNCYAVPSNNTTGYICRYRFSGLKPVTIFGLSLFGSYWSIKTVNYKYTGSYPYDDAPGGFERAQSQFVSSFNDKTEIIPNLITVSNRGSASLATNNGHFGHNFIPVASALDLQNQSYGSSTHFQSGSMYYTIDNNIQTPGTVTGNTLNPASLSPFTAVSTYTSDCSASTCQSYADDDPSLLAINGISQLQGANWNQWHEGRISYQAMLFLQRKILNTSTFTPCSSNVDFCNQSGFSISGPSSLCTTTGTYTVSSAYPLQNVNFQWSFPNGRLQITSGQGTKTITVSKLQSGQETVTVVMTNSCGQTSNYTLPVSVGAPDATTSTRTFTTGTGSTALQDCNILTTLIASGTYNGYVNINDAVATSIQWVLIDKTTGAAPQILLNPDQQHVEVRLKPQGAWALYQLNISNACGLYNPYVRFMANVDCLPELVTSPIESSSAAFSVNPNPSQDFVTVESTNKNIKAGSQKVIYSVRITDDLGTLRKTFEFKSGVQSTKISLAGLNSGIYVVSIFDGQKWSSHKLLVQK